MSFERLDSEVVHAGPIATVRRERWRQADGEVVEREVVGHPGAVGIVAHDDDHVWLVRQPREAVADPALLEIPAGKLDEAGETPLQTAQRELTEEIGKRAARWEEIDRFHTSPGFSDEEVILYEARDLEDVPGFEPIADERIEIVAWSLDRLDEALEETHDSKTLIGLLWLRGRPASRP
ncbi:MAG TPA: NUDIX hydrolase [Solirubrobacteraceae bacterium]|nr:NUDIX hydrolase [Solirubrobacteraceae bacterium]